MVLLATMHSLLECPDDVELIKSEIGYYKGASYPLVHIDGNFLGSINSKNFSIINCSFFSFRALKITLE